jgi:hypothetical protein
MSRGRRRNRRTPVSTGAQSDADTHDAKPAVRSRRWLLGGVAAIVAMLAALGGIASCVVLSGSDTPAGPPKAVIIDQLSLTFPNQEFVDQATATLEDAGYVVDYYSGEQVTVDLYRHLPQQGYDLVVLRAHSARIQGVFKGKQLDEAVIFTNEPYNDRDYLPEQVNARLDVAYTQEGAPRYFGITADFVELSMGGDFDGATVIMMGCEGLASDRTAEAFVAKGADHYVSWSDTVSATHTDAATERLIEYIARDGAPADDAVARTMSELGVDPAYDSELRAYPRD